MSTTATASEAEHTLAHLKDSKGRYHVRIPKQQWFLDRGVGTLPGYVWRSPKFLLRPADFMLDNPRLQKKLVPARLQIDSLEKFIEDPTSPMVYGVGSEPTDSPALYFAAYLSYLYTALNTDPSKHVHWESVSGGFRNKLIYEDGSINENIGMLVLSNVVSSSSNVKLEKVRDLLVAYSDVPRVVVIGGEDPLTFFSTKLHHKITNLFFNSGALANRANEIV
jgi:hypothetical protein